MKIYILFLICLSLLSLLTYNPLVEIERSTAIFIQILSGLFALHIMFSKNYIEMVRHQHEGVNFFKNFDERIQIEIEQNKLKKRKVRKKK